MALRAVIPENDIDGFEVNILKCSGSLVKNTDFSDLFIDHYLLVTVFNNGNNRQYSQPSGVRILISQLTEKKKVIVETASDDLIIILEPEQQLQAIKVCEICQLDGKKAVLLMMIRDYNDQSTHTCVFGLQPADNLPLQ